jgi:hypothetical protein
MSATRDAVDVRALGEIFDLGSGTTEIGNDLGELEVS